MTTEAIPPASADTGDATAAPVLRQQVLVLYLASSALDSHVVGWSRYDGTGRTSPTTGDSDEPPYESGVAALQDGWRLFQAAQLIPPYPGHEYDVSFLKHEFFFERVVDVRAQTGPDVESNRLTRKGRVTEWFRATRESRRGSTFSAPFIDRP